MAARQMSNESPQLLAVGENVQAYFDATASRTEITHTAKEVGRILRSIGDMLDTTPTVNYHQENRAERHSLLKQFIKVIDDTLEWLEHSGQMFGQKQEQVLRALYNLTELGNHAHLFAIMELACAWLNTDDDPFPGERQYIVDCLEDVKTQKEQIVFLVGKASTLMNNILQHEEVDYLQGRQFDNVVREANVLIESCQRRLKGANEAISELSQKMSSVSWASRGLRVTGWGFSSYFFWKRYQESSQSSMDLLKFGACVAVGGWLWMSLLPGRASVYYESLPKLQADHNTLRDKLEDLRVSLQSAKDHRDGL